MEGYEQHNEVSTSYNNNNLKGNFNEKDFYLMEDKREYSYVDKSYQKESQTQQTPFSVKDILNINQPNYTYDRNEVWKAEKERKNYEYYDVYSQQNQTHCPDYFNQTYSNMPLSETHTEHWNPEYHEHKVENYYNFSPYCHSLYHQNFEHYVDIEVPPYHSVVEPVKNDMTVVAPSNSIVPQEKVSTNSGYNLTEPSAKLSSIMSRKITSKF